MTASTSRAACTPDLEFIHAGIACDVEGECVVELEKPEHVGVVMFAAHSNPATWPRRFSALSLALVSTSRPQCPQSKVATAAEI